MFELTLKTDQPINSLTIVFDNNTPMVYSATESKPSSMQEDDTGNQDAVVLKTHKKNTDVVDDIIHEIDNSEILLNKMESSELDYKQQDIDFIPAEEESF